MAVRNAGRRQAFIWIPPIYTTNYKFTVEDSKGNAEDLTEILSYLQIEDGVTENIGRFEFKIWNPNETYTKKWTGGEIVRYYSDYAASATTLRFKGEIDKPSKRNNHLVVRGRSRALRFMDITVTQQFSNTETSLILKSLVDIYGAGLFTTTNVAASTTSLTVNWVQKPFFDAVNELATAAGFDFYIDANDDWHYFLSGSVDNSTDAMVHEANILDVGDFTPDLAILKNRVIVYGAQVEGIQPIASAEDSTSITRLGAKEQIINDDNVTTETQAQELADFRLAELSDPPEIGEVTSQLLATIQPGERIQVSDPPNGLTPQFYRMVSYQHTLDIEEGGLTTTARLNKEFRKTTHILKTIIEGSNDQQRTSTNPKEMRFSYGFLFDDDTGDHTNTVIANGVLKTDGGANGTWLSPTRNTGDDTVSQAYLLVNGTNIAGTTYRVSGNNGTSYDTITNKGLISLTSIGSNLRVEVTFTTAAAEIESLTVLYKV